MKKGFEEILPNACCPLLEVAVLHRLNHRLQEPWPDRHPLSYQQPWLGDPARLKKESEGYIIATLSPLGASWLAQPTRASAFMCTMRKSTIKMLPRAVQAQM